jgi:putative FmdB family regulatory protein
MANYLKGQRMPTYSFKCFEEDGGCGHSFEIVMGIKDYEDKQKCPICKKIKCVHRDYESDPINAQVILGDSEIKTVGHLAGRNRDKMSDEEKDLLKKKNTTHLEQRRLETNKNLPPGMKRLGLPEMTTEQKRERSKQLREKAKETAAKRKEQDRRKPPKPLKTIG